MAIGSDLQIWDITLKGEPYILVGDKHDGAITTRERFANFDESVAHLYSDGNVYRLGAPIGTRDDIVFIGLVEDL